MLTTEWTHDNINELRVKHSQHKIPWQLNSNATLKILWEISEWRQHLKNYNLEKWINPLEIISIEVISIESVSLSIANVWMT